MTVAAAGAAGEGARALLWRTASAVVKFMSVFHCCYVYVGFPTLVR